MGALWKGVPPVTRGAISARVCRSLRLDLHTQRGSQHPTYTLPRLALVWSREREPQV